MGALLWRWSFFLKSFGTFCDKYRETVQFESCERTEVERTWLGTMTFRELFADLSEQGKESHGWTEGRLGYEIGRVTATSYRYFLKFDPTPFLMKVTCPVLALGGTEDCQVPCSENLRGIEKTLKAGGNHNGTLKELPGLNHMFQTAVTGAVSEYGKIEETVAPAALSTITERIRKQTSY